MRDWGVGVTYAYRWIGYLVVIEAKEKLDVFRAEVVSGD